MKKHGRSSFRRRSNPDVMVVPSVRVTNAADRKAATVTQEQIDRDERRFVQRTRKKFFEGR